MPDSRIEKLASRIIGSGRADNPEHGNTYAKSLINDVEMAGLGVFDPKDELLIRDLAVWLQRRISHTLAPETADNRAGELLSRIREAAKQ